MRLATPDGQTFDGADAVEVVEDMRSRSHSPAESIAEFARETASRAVAMYGVEVAVPADAGAAAACEALVDGLIAARVLRLLPEVVR